MNQKGFANIILVVVIVILVGAVGYFAFVKKSEPITQQPAPTSTSSTQTPTPTPSAAKSYPLSLCGINVTVKTGQSVKTNTGNSAGLAWGQLTIGDAMPNSALEVSCTAKNKNPQSDTEKLMNDVSYVLGIQSSGSSKVNKNLYAVFNKQTLSSIVDLYSAKDRGYRVGSETIGFSTENWIYTFSFLNPAEAKNQNSFVISVNP